MKKVEILAPAGDMEALRVAIMNGADAVYLGMQKFNARAKAGNFTEENIGEVTRFAHLFGVKVYLTVNTLVKNSEMADFFNVVKSAVDAKVDAYLVQDFGVAFLLKEVFPGINLHASTQMGIHNLYGAKMAERLGFTRIVLSREAKLEDIKEIKAKTNLEIEYFVQGALCVAFSGNCYFSAFESGESGNRGMCKQLCRMRYAPQINGDNGRAEFLLSPSDLCLIKNLQKLMDAGVCSFKIEGRLRRAGYVGQAVSSYRKAVDTLLGTNNIDINKEIYNLRKVFSRGEFNFDAYLGNGVPDSIINKQVQNHLGIEIGKVVSVKPFKDLSRVTINSTQKLNAGDGLKFVNEEGEQVVSMGVGNVDILGKDEYAVYTKHKVQNRYKVYLILDNLAEQSKIDAIKRINVNARVVANVGKNLSCFVDNGEMRIELNSQFICEKAVNKPTNADEIVTQFSKMGDTHFDCKSVEVDTDGVFLPKSILNDLRRQAVAKLEQAIIDNNEKQIIATVNMERANELLKQQNSSKIGSTFDKIIMVDENYNLDNLQQIGDDILLVLSPTKYSIEVVEKFVKSASNFKNMGLNLPVVANGFDLVILKQIIDKFENLTLISNNLYGLYFMNGKRKVFAGSGMNVFNNFARDYLISLGVNATILSIEQKLKDFVISTNDYVYTLGKPALMTFCHCPYKTINSNKCSACSFNKSLAYVDQKNKKYIIRRTQISQCYFELLLSDTINNIGEHNQQQFLDLRTINVENIADIIAQNKKCVISSQDIIGKIISGVK